jgi:hypothetical protein
MRSLVGNPIIRSNSTQLLRGRGISKDLFGRGNDNLILARFHLAHRKW